MKVGERVVVTQIPGAVVLYEDGFVERFASPLPSLPASSEFINGVATKDITINAYKGTWARIFFPHNVAHRSPMHDAVPLVLHFHGGGMCLGSPAEPMYHNFCSRMASSSNSIWISVAYRLAPEHRLPAQYQDCYEAICWLRSQFATEVHPLEQNDADQISASGRRESWEIERDESTSGEKEPWLLQHGDAARVFLAGESAGATIIHFVASKAVYQEWSPLHIRGLMFVDLGVMTDPLPEMKPSTDPFVTTEMMAVSVSMCLPERVRLGDPLLDCLHPDYKHVFEVPWPPILMLVAERDLLRDSGMDYYKFLKQAHKVVEVHESLGKGHCFNLHEVDSEAAQVRERRMVEFMKTFSLQEI
eukprot:c21775_g2_i1 orf=395-1474(-)